MLSGVTVVRAWLLLSTVTFWSSWLSSGVVGGMVVFLSVLLLWYRWSPQPRRVSSITPTKHQQNCTSESSTKSLINLERKVSSMSFTLAKFKCLRIHNSIAQKHSKALSLIDRSPPLSNDSVHCCELCARDSAEEWVNIFSTSITSLSSGRFKFFFTILITYPPMYLTTFSSSNVSPALLCVLVTCLIANFLLMIVSNSSCVMC